MLPWKSENDRHDHMFCTSCSNCRYLVVVFHTVLHADILQSDLVKTSYLLYLQYDRVDEGICESACIMAHLGKHCFVLTE